MFTTVKTCVCLNDNFDRNTDDFPHCNADDERFLLLGWHAHKTYLVPAFFTVRRYASAVYAVVRCLSVRPSVDRSL